MLHKGECKHFNGILNEVCEAGILYRDVTPSPEMEEGSALRIPCIKEECDRRTKHQWSESQLVHIANKGTCATYTEPTDEEVAEAKRASDERIAFVVAELAEGRTPPGVLVCGPGNKTCRCNCPKACGHQWDGPEVRDEDPDAKEALGDEYVPSEVFTATCSKCGMWKFNHDMWVDE